MIISKVKIMSNRQCSKNIEIVPTICVENNFEPAPFWIFGILNVKKSQRQRNQGGHDSS